MTLVLSLFASCGWAQQSFYDSQVKPALVRGTDHTSLSLLGVGALSVIWAQGEDSSIRDQWRDNQKMSAASSRLGNEYGTFGIGFLIAGTQYYFDPSNGLSHVRALIAVTAVGSLLKFGFHRGRPNQANYYSFPSGHTYNAFATATSLSYAYGWKVGAIAFPLAAAVGLSRISDDHHWFSDVVGGAFLGVIIGRATYFSMTEATSDSAATSTSVWLPYWQNNQAGVQWVSHF